LDEVIPHSEWHGIIEASSDRWYSKSRFAFTVTSDGRLMSVPTGARVGDAICDLFSADVLYVLRPTRSNAFHSVIREYHLDDIMHGESLFYDTSSRDF